MEVYIAPQHVLRYKLEGGGQGFSTLGTPSISQHDGTGLVRSAVTLTNV
jgi:hypothetical protein